MGRSAVNTFPGLVHGVGLQYRASGTAYTAVGPVASDGGEGRLTDWTTSRVATPAWGLFRGCHDLLGEELGVRRREHPEFLPAESPPGCHWREDRRLPGVQIPRFGHRVRPSSGAFTGYSSSPDLFERVGRASRPLFGSKILENTALGNPVAPLPSVRPCIIGLYCL